MRHQPQDPPGHRRGGPGKDRLLVLTLEVWSAGSIMQRSSSGNVLHSVHVGQGRHLLHARCVIEASREAQHRHHSGAEQSTRSPASETGRTGGSGSSEPAKSQAGRADRRGHHRRRRPTNPGVLVRWDQNSLGGRLPLDAVLFYGLRQHFATGKMEQPQLIGAHTRLNVHRLGERRAGGVRPSLSNLLAENRRRVGRVPAEFWQLFLRRASPHWGKGFVQFAWAWHGSAGAMRQWRPHLEYINREVRQYGVAVPE